MITKTIVPIYRRGTTPRFAYVKILSLLICSCVLSTTLYAQDSNAKKLVLLKGYISNQNGEAVPGASLQVKGTNIAATAGADGSYDLQVPANSIVSVSSVGYLSKDIKVGAVDQILNFQLIANKNELDQVVVVGYGTRKRSDVTGAITSI